MRLRDGGRLPESNVLMEIPNSDGVLLYFGASRCQCPPPGDPKRPQPCDEPPPTQPHPHSRVPKGHAAGTQSAERASRASPPSTADRPRQGSSSEGACCGVVGEPHARARARESRGPQGASRPPPCAVLRRRRVARPAPHRWLTSTFIHRSALRLTADPPITPASHS